MKEISVRKLAEIVGAGQTGSGKTVKSVSIDSRKAKPGCCFFAIKGEKFDGHDFLEDAFDKGAVCAVVNRTSITEYKTRKYPLLPVDDTVKALGTLAKVYRNRANFKTVSVTGSVGKTTTRNIIYQVLSGRFECHQAPKSFNNDIGLPLTILEAQEDTQILLTELGSNYPGEIGYLTKIASPDIALITAAAVSHLEGFKNLESIIHEKLSIAEGLKPGGSLIINGDNERLTSAAGQKGLKFTTFGLSDKNDISASDIRIRPGSSQFKIGNTQVNLPLPGKAGVSNILAAWSVCRMLGVELEDFARRAARLKPVDKRTEILNFGDLTVISDCYNANPASMKNALEILSRFGEQGRRRTVFICGEMAELGEHSGELHKQLGKQIAESGVSILIAIGKQCRITGEQFAQNSGKQVKFFPDTAVACNNLEKIIEDTDIILVKGSRNAELEDIVDELGKIFTNTQADKRENK